jgi:hypothetical protein
VQYLGATGGGLQEIEALLRNDERLKILEPD